MNIIDRIVDSVEKTTGYTCYANYSTGALKQEALVRELESKMNTQRSREVILMFLNALNGDNDTAQRATARSIEAESAWLNGLYRYSGLQFTDIISENTMTIMLDGRQFYGRSVRLVVVMTDNLPQAVNPTPTTEYDLYIGKVIMTDGHPSEADMNSPLYTSVDILLGKSSGVMLSNRTVTVPIREDITFFMVSAGFEPVSGTLTSGGLESVLAKTDFYDPVHFGIQRTVVINRHPYKVFGIVAQGISQTNAEFEITFDEK